jgi:hypothetical protein
MHLNGHQSRNRHQVKTPINPNRHVIFFKRSNRGAWVGRLERGINCFCESLADDVAVLFHQHESAG